MGNQNGANGFIASIRCYPKLILYTLVFEIFLFINMILFLSYLVYLTLTTFLNNNNVTYLRDNVRRLSDNRDFVPLDLFGSL